MLYVYLVSLRGCCLEHPSFGVPKAVFSAEAVLRLPDPGLFSHWSAALQEWFVSRLKRNRKVIRVGEVESTYVEEQRHVIAQRHFDNNLFPGRGLLLYISFKYLEGVLLDSSQVK